MSPSAAPRRPLPVQVARNFAVWLVMVPALILLLNPIGDQPLPDADGWKRIALFGIPVVLLGAVIDALAERAASRTSRAYGGGFAVALMLFLFSSASRIAAGPDLPRLLKGLLVVPIVGAFLAVPRWTTDTYLSPPDQR